MLQGLPKQMFPCDKTGDFLCICYRASQDSCIITAKRFCDWNFTDAFVAPVVCSQETFSFSMTLLTLPWCKSSILLFVPRLLLIHWNTILYFCLFFFSLPLFTEQVEKALGPLHSNECWSVAEYTFKIWILLLHQMHVDKAVTLFAFFLSHQNSVVLVLSDLNFQILFLKKKSLYLL